MGKTMIPSGVVGDGNNGNNYTVTFVNSTNGEIDPAPLTITAKNQNKTYGATFTFAGTEFTTSTLYNIADTVTSITLTSTGAPATATVTAPGPAYPIVPSAAVGTGLTNYTITYSNGTLTVNPAPLTITTNNQIKNYAATVTFAGTEFTTNPNPLYNSDTVTSVTLTSAGAAATATVAGSPYPIVPSAAAGTGLANYTISYMNGSLTVNTGTASLSRPRTRSRTMA